MWEEFLRTVPWEGAHGAAGEGCEEPWPEKEGAAGTAGMDWELTAALFPVPLCSWGGAGTENWD